MNICCDIKNGTCCDQQQAPVYAVKSIPISLIIISHNSDVVKSFFQNVQN